MSHRWRSSQQSWLLCVLGAFARKSLMHTTSPSLLERLRQPSDRSAWARFVRLYTPLLCHWGRRVGLPPEDVDDLVQDVFAVLLQKLPDFRYRAGQRFRGWLWTVTVNKARERRRRAAPAGDDRGLSGVADPDPIEEFDEAEYRQFLVAQVARLIQAEFQPSTWKAFWEYVVADRPAAEVARDLAITENAVYIAKSRVLRRLRQELDGLLD
jgi:RNA polymerase sigma-70 factor (ECF subfamily)